MALLELVESEPNWMGALGVAMTRPPGVPERRDGEDPFSPPLAGRPRRVSVGGCCLPIPLALALGTAGVGRVLTRR